MPTLATDLSYVETEIKNISGSERYFGFIPPHGKRLAANEKVSVLGDINDQIAKVKRKVDALAAAVEDDVLRVTRSHRHVVYVDVDNTTVIAVGDLLYLDTDDAKPASSFTWDTNIATTQANFANVFLGVALEAHANGGGAVKIAVDISPDSYWDFIATSATHQIGDTVGPAKNPSADLLMSTTVVGAAATSSIGRVVRRDSAATATALIRVQSAYWGHNAAASQ